MRTLYLRQIVIVVLFLSTVVAFPAFAAVRKAPEPVTHEGGSFPATGRIAVRSGLAWLNESAPVFLPLGKELGVLLQLRGLTVVKVAPTATESKPLTELPPNADELTTPRPGKGQKAPRLSAVDESAQTRAAELAREGKLPKVKLREYAAPDRDADLPQSVRAIAPPDVGRALFALSQQKGMPLVQSLTTIPGRLPPELGQDAAVADYALIVRFAMVQSPTGVSSLDGYSGAAALGFGGRLYASAPLGFGQPAQPSSTGRNNYGTPGGYVRGYENPAGPNDIWHRDSDFFQRDYMLKNSPPASTAEPPSGFSPSRDGYPGGTMVSPGRGGPSGAGLVEPIYLLQMECFDLEPARKGKKPPMVWRAFAQQPAGTTPLAAALPGMAIAIFKPR